MRRKVTLILLMAMLSVLLSGCLPWSAEDSYKLPQPPEHYKNLVEAVAQTKRELAQAYSTTVEDVPPSAGDNTSTVQLLDMDEDGSLETAVTFFRVVGAEEPVRLYFYTLTEDENYRVSNVIQGEGDSVYAVHYADLDGASDENTGKPCKEVVVSWQMGSDINYLGVYALEGGQTLAQTLIRTAYQSYRMADLDRDGLMELTVGRVDQELGTGEVEMHNWDASGLDAVERAPLSAGVSAITAMRANYLTDFVPALYVSGQLADGSRVTDVVALRGGRLTNLALDPDTGISREQVSTYRDLAASDVNNDSILEIARPYQLERSVGGVKPWLVDWVQYTGSRAKNICTTYHNSADDWYLVIPEHWRDKLVIYRNDSVSGQRAVIFARWQGEEQEPMPFLSIYKLTGASRSLRATSGNRFILAEDSSTIYAAAFYNTWDCGLDQNGLLENFRLIVRDWSGD